MALSYRIGPAPTGTQAGIPSTVYEEVEVTFGSEYKGVCIEADADTACVSSYHLKVPGVGG